MPSSTQIEYFYNSEVIILSDPVAQYQVRLNGDLTVDQHIVFNINGSTYSVDGPIANYDTVTGDGYTIFNNNNTLHINLKETESQKIFTDDGGTAFVALFEYGAVIDLAIGTYETFESKVTAEGDFVPTKLTLVDETNSSKLVLDAADTRLAIIEVGALWCPPTIGLAEDSENYTSSISKDFSAMTFLIAGYNQIYYADQTDASGFVAKYDLDFPVYSGNVLSVVFDGGYVPHFLIVDQITGEVLKTFTGVSAIDTGDITAPEAYSALAEIEAEGDTAGLTITGVGTSESLFGSARADTIRAGAGADYVDAGIGTDQVFGNEGEDVNIGGRGGDTLRGGLGADLFKGEQGDDRLKGGRGGDTLSGGLGEDVLKGQNGNDDLFGGRRKDVLSGGNGADYLDGGKGDDRLFGNDGDDLLFGDAGNDFSSGGNGDEDIYASLGDDTLQGGAGADFFVFDANFDRETILDFSIAEDILSFEIALAAGLTAKNIADLAQVVSDGVLLQLAEAGDIFLQGLTSTSGLEAAIETYS